MSLTSLSLTEMVGITRVWTVELRPRIAAVPQLAGWLPSLDAVHLAVVKAQPTVHLYATELAAIAAEQAFIDARFDDMARVLSMGMDLEAVRCRLHAQERAAACEKMKAKLFPEGLTIVNAAYFIEAGHTERALELLSSEPGLKALLASIPLAENQTLLFVAEEWCLLGVQLSSLEGKKATLMGETPAPTRAETLAARTNWLKAINALLVSFSAISGHDNTISALRAPVDFALALVAKRGPRAQTTDTSLDPDDLEEPAPAATNATGTTPAMSCPASIMANASPATTSAFSALAESKEIPPGMPGSKPYVDM